jgi:hypothetical protein
MVDYQHENFWEKWLNEGWQIAETLGSISPFNTLWMTFFFLSTKKYKLGEE